MQSIEIHTIGHSNYTWESFSTLLKRHGVQTLVDVRTNPVSRWAPFANRRTLPGLLEQEAMGYVYMGEALGGKPADPSYYNPDGKPEYARMRSKTFFQDGISQLLELARESRTVLMCAEEDPSGCHRTLLIGPPLEKHGVTLLHIRKDG